MDKELLEEIREGMEGHSSEFNSNRIAISLERMAIALERMAGKEKVKEKHVGRQKVMVKE